MASKATKKTTTAKKTTTKVAADAKAANTKAANRVEEMVNTAGERMKEASEKVTGRMEDFASKAQDRAKEAAEKMQAMGTDAVEFQKANVEAMVESAKIAAKGMQDIAKHNAEYARENFEATTSAFKEMSTVKSPTDFMKMQQDNARKGFDTAVSQASQNTEAMMKLMGEAFQPISDRFTAAAESFRKAA